VISTDTVGAPARLIVRGAAPDSPAHFAGIEPGDQIVAVDGKPVEGQKPRDVAAAIRGEVGSSVKLTLNRQGQSREVSLSRVARPGL
jgi:carboxyl-terminal processing protease